MRILLLTQWFYPEPAFKTLPLAKEWMRLGHEVQVLTGFPNYPEGRIYDGYRLKLFQRETIEGVPILRVPLYASHDQSSVKRMLNYLSFAAFATLLGPFLTGPTDAIYVYHPPATVALPAAVLGALRHAPTVYDIQDLWPDTLTSSGMVNPRIVRAVDGWCNWLYRRMDHLTVISPGFRRKLMERGVPPPKVDVMYNWCEEDDLFPTPPEESLAEELGFTHRFNVVFAGNLGPFQALDKVIEAAALLESTEPEVQFVFVGGGMSLPELKAQAERLSLKNIRFIPRMTPKEVNRVLNLADVLLVHLKDEPLTAITIPSKTQAYMRVGKPILMGVKGDAADLVERAAAGVTCLPESPKSIAEAVQTLVRMTPEDRAKMGRNGSRFYEEQLSLRIAARRLLELFDQHPHKGRRDP